jgi:hypothetical protein
VIQFFGFYFSVAKQRLPYPYGSFFSMCAIMVTHWI